jgi:hypothetical protein
MVRQVTDTKEIFTDPQHRLPIPFGGEGFDPCGFIQIWNLLIENQLDPDLNSKFLSAAFCKKCVKSSFDFLYHFQMFFNYKVRVCL